LSIETLAESIAVTALTKLEEVDVEVDVDVEEEEEEESWLDLKFSNRGISRSGLDKRPGRDRWLKRRARGSEMLRLILYITYIELFLQKK
jgi:hypothetical protein